MKISKICTLICSFCANRIPTKTPKPIGRGILHCLELGKTNTRTINYMRQTNTGIKETKEIKKGKISLSFNEIEKVWILDKSRKVLIIEVV